MHRHGYGGGPGTATGMEFDDASPLYGTAYLLGPVLGFSGSPHAGTRVLDLGCGNGFWAGVFAGRGCTVVGIDSSPTGIDLARATHQGIRFEVSDIEPNILATLDEDPFDLVVSTEVIEHVYSPQTWADACVNALRPGGTVIVSTPYHGWLKNVALATTGKLDRHFDAMREGGHIKFFSRPVLSELLGRSGFVDIRFAGAGRAPLMWKSMVLAATKPT